MGDAAQPMLPGFRSRISAGRDDIDELGHVSNIAYVRWIQEVAAQHSAAHGLAFQDYVRLGGVFVVRRHEIEYLAPAFAGDEIELSTEIVSFRGASSERRTRMVRVRDDVLLARASTLWAYVSRETGRPSRIPVAVQQAFAHGPFALPDPRDA